MVNIQWNPHLMFLNLSFFFSPPFKIALSLVFKSTSPQKTLNGDFTVIQLI
jgi:hypothetical protein